MVEIVNPFEILGIRADLLETLDDQARGALTTATSRVLQGAHHPDRGGDAALSYRVNEAKADLSEVEMVSALRDEYLEANPFSERFVEARAGIEKTAASARAFAQKAAEFVASGALGHMMDVVPCRVRLLVPSELCRAMANAATVTIAKEREGACLSAARAEEEYQKRITVAEEEVEAVLSDPSKLHLYAGHLEKELRSWVDAQMKLHHKDLFFAKSRVGQSREEVERWRSRDLIGGRYEKVEGEIMLSFYERKEIQEKLRGIVRKDLERMRRQMVDAIQVDDNEDPLFHGDDDDEARPSKQDGDPRFGRARGDRSYEELFQFTAAHKEARDSAEVFLTINELGELRLELGGEKSRMLQGVVVVGALRTIAPSQNSPIPWNEGSLSVDTIDGIGAPKRSTKSEKVTYQFGGLGISQVSETILTNALCGKERRNSTLLSPRFDTMLSWVNETNRAYALGYESECISLLVSASTEHGTRKLEVLGEVVEVELL